MNQDSVNVSAGATSLFSGNALPDVPEEVAILSVPGVVVFPLMISPVNLNEDLSRDIADDVMRGDRLIALFHPLPEAEVSVPVKKSAADKSPRLRPVGTLCTVLRMLRIPDGSVRLLLHGICRVTIDSYKRVKPYPIAKISRLAEQDAEAGDFEVEAIVKLTMDSVQRAIGMSALSEDLAVAALNVDGPGKLADLVASNLPIKVSDLLPILEEPNHKARLRKVHLLLGREVHVMEISSRINDEVRDEVDKSQRSFFLQQQMRAIRKELGETDPHEAEMEELARRVEACDLPDHARKVAEKELSRLQSLPTAAAEYGVIRTYLEWILDIPWRVGSNDSLNIELAHKILEEDHYGLEEVKTRILEFLSVIRLKKGELKGPILCFVGPPGVGKTSLGRSIARATGREFHNFSLGGMRDEAEIRGHRRTYVGAMPGRIIKALKDSGTNNPLIMLDEIDKLGSDFRGDPASALLEVLDPEQNNHFNDHYIDIPVDLSRVMFITTANTLDSIPEPLRDRMEIIRIAGYTELEKQEIARRYLVPREMENSGLSKKDIAFAPAALKTIIDDYTAEAGVRSLQREIGKVCRKVAMKVAAYQSSLDPVPEPETKSRRSRKPAPPKPAVEKPEKAAIAQENLEKYLGPRKTYKELAERMGRPGVSIGLAWTSIGGAILFIEAARYPGKGELRLTGQLGDVMKESAQAALTYLKSNRESFEMPEKAFSDFDYHVHVPAGATPKDGPSAGVAIATALASLITERPVRDFVAMSGEITLRGNAMPVGGIKEKCLAAHRAGVKQVFLPRHNEGDYQEVPQLIRKAIKVSFFENVRDYIQGALR